MEGNDLSAKIWEKIAKRFLANGVPEDFVDTEILHHTKSTLLNGVKKGLDAEGWYGSEADHKLLQDHFRINVHYFSVFKTHAQLREVTDLMLTESGHIKSWSQFKKEVMPKVLVIDSKYQENYLQAEYETAVSSAQMATRWHNFKKAGVEWLEFRTSLDERVREEHRALHGIRRKITDSFWNVYYPPLDWRCRCTAVAADGPGDNKDEGSLPEIKPMFRRNVGETGVIFKEDHPYFSQIPKAEFKDVFKRATELLDEIDPSHPEYDKIYKSWLEYQRADPAKWIRQGFNPKTGTRLISQKPTAWQRIRKHEKEFYQKALDNGNVEAIEVLQDWNHVVLPQRKPNWAKEADCKINGTSWELKSYISTTSIYNRVKKDIVTKHKQSKTLLLSIQQDNFDALSFAKAVLSGVMHSGVEMVWIWKDFTPLRTPFSRDEILSKGWITMFIKLTKAGG